VDFDNNREMAMQTVEYMRRAMRRNMAILAVSASMDSESIISAMRCGCTEYLPQPLQAARIAEVLTQLQKRRVDTMLSPVHGKMSALMGVKGGVGSTTLASHLAIALTRAKQKTLLVDTHIDLGDLTLHLGLEHHNYGFHELVNNLQRFDAELLQGFVMRHDSGLEVLLSPESFITPPSVTADSILVTLKSLVRMFNNVIVDCGPGLTDMNMSVLEATDELYLVTTPELPAVRNLARYLEYVGQLIPSSKIKIVVNRTAKQSPISNEHIEKVVKQKISLTVPFAGTELTEAIGAGIPVGHKSRSEFALAMNRWATQLNVSTEAEVSSKSEAKASEPRRPFSLLRI
jgi:pilus assembly protein CpaE